MLGPNRAGKTTLVKALLSICFPTAGTILRLGRPLSCRGTLAQVGYMHENPAFPRYLTAPRSSILRRPFAWSSRRGTWPGGSLACWTKSASPTVPASRLLAYSKGMLQRLALAQALVNDPELLVLDEPTEGMDLSARKLLHEIVLRRKAEGKTAILVSHSMADVGRLCDEAAVLRGGQLSSTDRWPTLPVSRRAWATATPCRKPSSPLRGSRAMNVTTTLSAIFRLVKDTFRQSIASGICWLWLG